MRNISSEMETHLQQETTTICSCWKITPVGGTSIGFTDFTENLTIDSVVYYAIGGYSSTAISFSSDGGITNLDITGLLETSYITKADLEDGVYDYAEVEIFIVNYMDLTMGQISLKKGWFSSIKIYEERYTTELVGLIDALHNSKVCESYSPQCRASLGDTRCGVTLATYLVAGTVVSVTSQTVIVVSGLNLLVDDYFNFGKIIFTSGDNNGKEMEVKDWIQLSASLTLFLPLPYEIKAADTFNIYPGCDRAHTTCYSKFNNIVNFRGEPFLPGIGEFLAYVN